MSRCRQFDRNARSDFLRDQPWLHSASVVRRIFWAVGAMLLLSCGATGCRSSTGGAVLLSSHEEAQGPPVSDTSQSTTAEQATCSPEIDANLAERALEIESVLRRRGISGFFISQVQADCNQELTAGSLPDDVIRWLEGMKPPITVTLGLTPKTA